MVKLIVSLFAYGFWRIAKAAAKRQHDEEFAKMANRTLVKVSTPAK